jgi:hypothetical protein
MKKILYLLAFTALVNACGPSVKVSQSWVAPNTAPGKFKKIVVLVLAPAKYNDAGRIGEQQLASELKSNGVNAMSAQDEYGPSRFRNKNEEAALAAMRRSGADAVIVTSLLDIEKEKRYVPGSYSFPPYYGRFWGYYSYWYGRSFDQGYYETTKKYYLETNLYDLSNSQLVYSIQSRTMDPGSADRLARAFSKVVVKDMRNKQVI